MVKEFWKLVSISQSYRHNQGGTFSGHGVLLWYRDHYCMMRSLRFPSLVGTAFVAAFYILNILYHGSELENSLSSNTNWHIINMGL